MTKSKYFISFTFASFYICTCGAQLKVATLPGTPNVGAILDVESSNRGFTLPRINLTSLTMPLNGGTPPDGTIIFSNNWTGTGLLGGTFVWRQGKWNALEDSKQTISSHVRVVRTTNQSMAAGDDVVLWNQATDQRQPVDDPQMWTSSNPGKIIIRRPGFYFVSASVRRNEAIVGEPIYIAIIQNSRQVTATGSDSPGTPGTFNSVTLNTSTMIYCEANDEIQLINYGRNPTVITPSGLETTQLSVTQLPKRGV